MRDNSKVLCLNKQGAMALRSRLSIVVASAVALLTSCGLTDSDVEIDEYLPCTVQGLEVADTTLVGEPILAHITGTVGPDCSYHLECVMQQSVGATWLLRPIAHHRVEAGHYYCAMVIELDEVVVLEALRSGWVYVVVLSRGPALLDSTFVKPLQNPMHSDPGS